jgi:hypothetical protein
MSLSVSYLKWCIGGLMVVLTMVFIGWVRFYTVTFVPFKYSRAPIYDAGDQAFVTLPEYYSQLKWRVKGLKKIASMSAMQPMDVILLPWKTDVKGLAWLPIDGVSFFDSDRGVIRGRSFRPPLHDYDDFLKHRVVLTFGGTVVLARGVHRVIQKQGDPHFPWRGTRSLFDPQGINIINFKSPLVVDFLPPSSSWVLVGPTTHAVGLASANIHVAGIAGNHMGDAKKQGLTDTIQALTSQGVVGVGAGENKAEAYACRVIDRQNTRFGFLSFNNVWGSIGKAGNASAGIAWLDQDALAAIQTCAKTVDFLTVLVNWGIEYTHVPRPVERQWARKMAGAGADLIMGDQAHWVQSHEQINTTHVSYGLGNYIFDQHWSQNTKEGVIQKVVVYRGVRQAIQTFPIQLQSDGQVQLLSPDRPRYSAIMAAYHLKLKPMKSVNKKDR